MKKLLLLLAVSLLLPGVSRATHILGGELTYRFLGLDGPAGREVRYLIHFVGYVDRVGTPGQTSNWGCGNLEQNPFLVFYQPSQTNPDQYIRIPRVDGTPDQAPYTTERLALLNYALPTRGGAVQGPCPIDPYFGGMRPLVIAVPQACVVPGLSELDIAITDTTFEVQLPFSPLGYKIKYENCCRSENTTNLFFPGGNNNPGNTWEATIPSLAYLNSSPQFIGDAVPFFCRGDTAFISNNAFDPDGDRLIYSFETPYSDAVGNSNFPANPVFPTAGNVSYRSGFSVDNPFGPGGYAFINPSTGLTKYYANANGNYAVAVKIEEYRTLPDGSEQKIGETRREFLVVVKDCSPNPPPNPIFTTSSGTTFVKSEGDSVVFDLKSFDVDTTTITAESELFNPDNGTGAVAVCPSVTGVDTVKTRFRWKIDCGITGGIVRNYSVVVKYADKGCPPKTNTVVYTIIVNPFKAPKFTGKDSICSTDQTVTYNVTPGTGRQWKISGGSIVGSSTGNTVTVSIPGDTANIRLVVTSGLGCKDSTFKKVRKFPFVPIVATAPSPFVCQDSSLTLNAAGGYTSVLWAPSAGLSSATSRNPKATVSDTAQYIVSSSGPGGCLAKDTLNVIWVPRIANAGSDSILCSGLSRIIGAPQATGYRFYSYSWLPSSGLESDTSFRTRATLLNGGSSNQTITLVQRAVHRASGCASTDTVRLVVKPLPVVNAGADTTVICSGGRTLLGVPDDDPAVFAWTPATGTGLLSPDRDTTSVTLNPDSLNPVFIRYYLTKTESLSTPLPGEPACVNQDSIVLRINPLPFFDLAAKDSICSGFRTEIGTTGQNGFSYAWSPVNGLSDSDSSRTGVQLVNSTNQPADTVYSLLVTNTLTTCSRSKDIRVRVNPLPQINAGLDTSFCSGDSIQIGETNQTGFSYAWLPGSGLSSGTVSNPRLSLLNPANGGADQFFIYKVTKQNNQTTCRKADSLQIRVKALPIVNAALSDSLVVCSKSGIQLGEAGRENHNYLWTPDTALTSSSVPNPVLNINNPFQSVLYLTYRVRATNTVSTCRNTDSVVVKINPLPIVPLAYADTAVCSRDTIRIGGSATPGYSYTWSPKIQLADSTLSLTAFTAVNSGDSPVTYAYNLDVKINATGCRNARNLNVRVNPLPDAGAGSDQTICSGDTIQIGVPPVAGRRYRWLPSEGLSDPNISNPRVSVANPGTTEITRTYTVLVTDTLLSTRCDSSDSMVLTIRPLPSAVAYATDSVSVCATIGLGLGTVAETGLAYQWSPATNLSSATVSDPVFTSAVSTGGAFTPYELTVTNPVTTCRKKDKVFIRVHALPIPNAGLTDSLCSGDTITIGPLVPVEPVSYQWLPSSGLVGNNPVAQLLTLVNTGNTVLTVPYKFIATNTVTGCKDSSSLTVRVNPLPPVNAGPDRIMCSGETVGLGDDPVLGFNYLWNASPGLNLTGISNPQFSNISLATVTDTLVLLMTNGTTQCRKRDTVLVRTNPRPVSMTFAPFSPVVCPFTPNVPYTVSNPVIGTSYAWSVSGGTQSSGSNTNAITVDWSGSNPNAKIRVTPTNEFGCIGKTDSLLIIVNTNLNPVKPIGDSVLCSFDRNGRLYSTLTTPGSVYTWKMVGASVDSVISATGNATINWLPEEGITRIWIQEQSATVDPGTGTPVQCYGTSDTLRVRINRSPDSTRNVRGAASVCTLPGGSQAGFAFTGFAGSQYQWAVSPDPVQLSGQGSDSVRVVFQNTGPYTVTVTETSSAGCAGKPRPFSLNVFPQPSPGLSTGSLSICSNDLQRAYLARPSFGSGNSTFLWALSGGTASTPLNQPFLGVDWAASGAYILRLTETSLQGCSKDTVLPLVFDGSALRMENVSLLEADDSQAEVLFRMENTGPNPNKFGLWRRELNAPASAWTEIAANIPQNTIRYIDQPGSTSTRSYQYQIRSKNICGKSISSDAHNTILLSASADAVKEESRLSWNPYIGWPAGPSGYDVLRGIGGGAIGLYESGVAVSVSPERVYTNAGDGFRHCYRIRAEEKDGSNTSLSNTVCIEFKNLPGFYTLITADDNGKNESFQIKNLALYPENELTVVNRWGKEVFSARNYSPDALWEPQDLEDGVYYFTFRIPSIGYQNNGWFMLRGKK